MISGILGKKVGMTQIFTEEGTRVTITVVKAGPCQVQAVKNVERDGYNAVQLGFDDTTEKHLKKPQREYLKKNNLSFKRFVREIRCADKAEIKIGDTVTNSIFQQGDFLDITGISKGKGFQGGMKRCGWVGGAATHGSMFHRAPGSIGASSFPSRVTKGHGMAGHMGADKVTIQNIEVVDVDTANNTIAIKGALPGANGTYLVIRYAKKKTIAPRGVIPEKKKEEAEAPQVEKKGKAPKEAKGAAKEKKGNEKVKKTN